MTSLAIKLLVGAGLGALLGYFGQCNSGTCPLTANWKRGALYGAVLGLMFHLASGGGSYEPPKNVKLIAEANFDAEVMQAGKPVVVDFFATWCGPCKTLSPRLDKLAGEYGDRIKFVSLNYDLSADLVAKLNVPGVPLLLFVGKDGRIADAILGVESVEMMRLKMEALLALEASGSLKQAGPSMPEKL